MAQERKRTKTRHHNSDQRIKQSHRANKEQTAQVPGAPPTDNLRKHPDEVYGDTEIPERGRSLDKIKKESR
jgi:hypothetical protein